MTFDFGLDLIRYAEDVGTRSIILDRDGTLNFDNGYTYKIDKLIILPKVKETLAYATSNNINLYIASNQGGVSLGKYSLDEMREFNLELVRQLALSGANIQAAACCTHHPQAIDPQMRKCRCRKPHPKLLTELIGNRIYNEYNDLMVGDSKKDEVAAASIKLNFISVATPSGWDAVKVWIKGK